MIRFITLLTVTLLLTISCSDGSDADPAQVATSAQTATVPQPTPAPAQTSGAVAPAGTTTTATPTEPPLRLDILPPLEFARQEKLQVGLNFIRFYWHDETDLSQEGSVASRMDYVQPEAIFGDLMDLRVHAFRQFIKADLLWDKIEPHDDQWDFSRADEVITNANLEPIVTLFRLQYASPTPPWTVRSEDFQRTLGPDAEDYLRRLVGRYGEYITYWELGNEMDHWAVAYDPSSPAYKRAESKLPAYSPADGFSPQDQGVFLKQVAEFIRERDPDAVIVLPGFTLAAIADDWLEEVIKGAGTSDWFDVVNYHFYGSWERHKELRPKLDEKLKELGIDSKSVWLTETGSTSSPTLKVRTNYPNSDESQCADVFRRIIQGYAFGDEFVAWHTYIGSTGEGNDWRDYGLRNPDGSFKPSYYAFRLLVEELIPFETVEMISGMPEFTNLYLITTRGGVRKYVVWGRGTFEIPTGMRELTSVFPNDDGSFDWEDVREGTILELFDLPVLLR